MLRNKNTNEKGFTIIEVVITIAIGAAVMALVLNAVQGARRSQRNLNRKADVSAIAGAVNQYNANRNKLPAIWGDLSAFITDDDLAHYKTANINAAQAVTAGIGGFVVLVGQFQDLSAATIGTAAFVDDDTRDRVVIFRGAECVANQTTSLTAGFNTLVDNGSIRQMIAIYSLEGDDVYFCTEL